LDEYHIIAARAGYTAVVRIQAFHTSSDGTERARVIAERSTDVRTLKEPLTEWIKQARHECREALEVGPGTYLDDPRTVLP